MSAFIAALAGVGVLCAQASPPPLSSLEQQAEAEFAKAGLALHERLNREAAGDPVGAGIAAHEAEAHRYRYLDLKRELSRLHPQPSASPSVAAPRDPFIPDAPFLAESGASSARAVLKTAGGRGKVGLSTYPSWDMYRPRPSMEAAETRSTPPSPALEAVNEASVVEWAKDMYATDSAKRAPTAQRAPPEGAEALIPSAEAPRRPFLVYRVPSGGPGARP